MTDRDKGFTLGGFTLVELAISLMVIGFLIGGVLKGVELIENGKITAAMRMMTEYKTAALAFRSSYGEYPGDMRNPQQRLPDCMTPVCSAGGGANDKITFEELVTHNAGESHNFAVHLSKSGYMSGPSGGTDAMAAADTDTDRAAFFSMMPLQAPGNERQPFLLLTFVTLHGGTPPTGVLPLDAAHYYLFSTTGAPALMLDRKMDDGLPFTGMVRDNEYNSCYDLAGARSKTTGYDRSAETCHLKVWAGF